MHPVHAFAALAMTGCTAALPQLLPLEEVAQISGAPIEKVPTGEGAGTQVVPYAPDPVVSGTYASVLADPASASKKVERRGWDCSDQPLGKGPVPTPDTPEAFLAMEEISNAASNAPTPSGYALKFKNLKASNNAIGYLGYNTLDTYDTQACADFCTAKEGCSSFNIYFERDPSVVPADACPNPDSTTVIKCVMWGSYIGPSTAVNDGQWRKDFHVVIAGSNGYVDERVPTVPGYSGEYLNNVAINAPKDCNGDDTYMGYKLFNDGKPFDAQRCAAACEAETQYNVEHLNSRMLCKYFNTYVLNKNGEPQGQYCSMYTQKWDKTYAVNDGQWRGDDHYTIEYSYSFSNTTDPGKPKLPCDVAAAKSAIVASSLQPFCSTLLGYTTPVSTVVETQFTTVPASTQVNTLTPVTTTTTTTTQAFAKRDVSPETPAALATFAPTAISSACSLQATPVTETATTSTTTIATVPSGTTTTFTTLPLSTKTVTSTATPSPTCTASGVNLIQNSGFENGMTYWSQSTNRGSPTQWSAVSGGFNSGSSYMFSSNSAGASVNLIQQVNGMTPGVTYTFTYMYYHTDSPASSINCAFYESRFTSQSATGDSSKKGRWNSGPDVFGDVTNTFVAKTSSATLTCTIGSRGVQNIRMDDFRLAC